MSGAKTQCATFSLILACMKSFATWITFHEYMASVRLLYWDRNRNVIISMIKQFSNKCRK